jgi:hypothetical protein
MLFFRHRKTNKATKATGKSNFAERELKLLSETKSGT